MAEKILALIGAGGKTTAMKLLARQSGADAVLLTTTTHIFPMEDMVYLPDPGKETLCAALKEQGIVCAGSVCEEGKLGILPPGVLEPALEKAAAAVYEGDGSRRLPLKLHKEGEPVILPQTTHCLILAGLSALGKPIGEAVHRHKLNPNWNPKEPVGVEELVSCVLETAEASGLPKEKIKVFLNQADTLGNPQPAMDAAEILRFLGLDTRYGSLREEPNYLYAWVTEGGFP